jgi:hypothetical protein
MSEEIITKENELQIEKKIKEYQPLNGVLFVNRYGTAGFRNKAGVLKFCVFSVGVLSCLRAMKNKKITGVMITASHNQYFDNGCKIIDSNGEMLDQRYIIK